MLLNYPESNGVDRILKGSTVLTIDYPLELRRLRRWVVFNELSVVDRETEPVVPDCECVTRFTRVIKGEPIVTVLCKIAPCEFEMFF